VKNATALIVDIASIFLNSVSKLGKCIKDL